MMAGDRVLCNMAGLPLLQQYQNSLLLWPFAAAFLLIFLLIYDLWR